MTSEEKELTVLRVILLLIPERMQEYPDFSDGAVIFSDEIIEHIIDVPSDDVRKILWKWNRLGIIESGPQNTEPYIIYTKKICDYRKTLEDKPRNQKIEIVLYSDNYLCIKGFSKINKHCLLRTKKGKHKRVLMLRILAQNHVRDFTGSQLAELAGYKNTEIARNEFKRLFTRIAHDLDYKVEDLFESDANGYHLKCLIEIIDSRAT